MPQPRRHLLNRYTILTILGFGCIATVFLISGGGRSRSEGEAGPSPVVIVEPAAYRQQEEGEGHGGGGDGRSSSRDVITTEDVVAGRYYGKGANCSWTPDGNALSWLSGSSGDLVRFEVVAGGDGEKRRWKKQVVVRADQFASRPWKVKFSGDQRFVLVGFEPRRLFRTTILARYAVHSTRTGQLLHHLSVGTPAPPTPTDDDVVEQQQQAEVDDANNNNEDPQSFQLATWANDNKTILLVYKNDVYAVRLGGSVDDDDDESSLPTQQQQHNKKTRIRRLTWDGSETVFNGVADWVYEEELFTTSSTAIFPSHSNNGAPQYVTYLKFNDTLTPPSTYNLYSGGDSSYSNEPFYDGYYQYPKFGTVRYPKSGMRNPSVSVHVVRLDGEGCWGSHDNNQQSSNTGCSTWEFGLNEMMQSLVGGAQSQSSPSQHHPRYSYLLGSFQWLKKSSNPNDDVFTMNILNRIQNTTWLVECSAGTRRCDLIHRSTQVGGWIDNGIPVPYYHHRHHGNEKDAAAAATTTRIEYFTIQSVEEGQDGLLYGGIVGVSRGVSRVVTRGGAYTVDEVVGVYQIGGLDVLVFKSGLIGVDPGSGGGFVNLDSVQAHYYAVEVGGGSSSVTMPTCLTCYRSECTYNSGKFGGRDEYGGLYFVNSCEREGDVSRVEVVRVTLDQGGGGNKKKIVSSVEVLLEGNEALERRLGGIRELPEVEYLRVPYQVGGSKGGKKKKSYYLNCKVVGPKGWKVDGGVYPVVVDIYGGPNSQKVTRRFTPNDWSYSLASRNHNNNHPPVVYLIIDGIGSGRQSNSMAFEVYRDLGNSEIVDKIYAVKWFLEKYPGSLDPERTLIWGWSYGGYVSGMVLGRDTGGVLKCGVSVAPVVNWYYYDTIYTERYMSTPEDNPRGYNSSNILRYLDGFKGKDYLLVHGNADDNVHYQQSMVLARGLELKNILFRMQSYPDENHSLGSVRPHLFATLEDFVFNQCFRSDKLN